MRQSHLILSNAAVMWATQVLQLVPQLILVPYLIGTIGESGYGVYALVWSLMISIEQLQSSLQQGVVKYSAGFLAQERIDEVNSVVSSSFVYSIVLAGIACAGMLVAAAFFKDPSGQISSVLVVVGIMILLIGPTTPYIAVIQSRQRYYVGAIAGTVAKYGSLLAVAAWFHMVKPSVEALIIIMAGSIFLARLVQVPVAYRLVPGLHNRLSLCNRQHLRLIISFGGMVVLIGLFLTLNSTGVRWLMNALASTAFVAHLAIMLMPSGLLSGIVEAMTITAMPATSAYQATENYPMLQELLIRGMRYSMILLLAGLLTAFLLMRNVLGVWVGGDYVFLAPYALALFAGNAFMLSTSISHHMLKGLGKLRAVVLIYLIGLVIVPVGLILGVFHVFGNPYIAVTVGLTAGQMVCGCLNIRFCIKAIHASLRELFIRVYAQPLAVVTMIGAPVFGIVTFIGWDGLVARILLSVLAVLLFFGGCYASISTVSEQQEIKVFYRMLVDRMAAIQGLRSKRTK